jgi:hypothetical protein
MSLPVSVDCTEAARRWRCEVVVGSDASATRHQVTLSPELLERLRPGAQDPVQLVHDSFAFLLARESRESILRSFELEVIGRYFGDWEAEIQGGRGQGV